MPGESTYTSTDASFWTSGFFPGSLYLLRERQRKWPDKTSSEVHSLRLQFASRWWSHNLHQQASLQGTHDLGFLIQPWTQRGWELDGDRQCYDSLVTAAYGLAERFDPKIGCIRSWDTCFTKRYSFADPSEDFLVIIDNMMNLDLLYYVSELVEDQTLSNIATRHAFTSMNAHIREDNSTCHVVNFDPTTGRIKQRMTNQGYSDESCWSRGQAWGITGYAQCYHRTKDDRFLQKSIELAEYFLSHLPKDGVPYWDFDAPKSGPRDTSAAMIAAYGLLLLHESINGDEKFLADALRLVGAVCENWLSPEARFVASGGGEAPGVDLGGHDTILLGATINNYEFAPRRWADHGLVYADYYFLLVGNKLLEMGLA
ncbi:hypothetical protein PRZ48_002941 [Zasmidium cellare]|uniref:Glucuronyl hydrolase n=1 Tax=Zasmidium cellare TaxID=395010 RepID=A0ABR0EV06_ZASCE|nr:hypothetical protein PRZ48_002941 [Zasmidium cellare]